MKTNFLFQTSQVGALPSAAVCDLPPNQRAEELLVSAILRDESSKILVSEHFSAQEAPLALEIAESLGVPILRDSGLARLIRALPCNSVLDEHLLHKLAQIAQRVEAWWIKSH